MSASLDKVMQFCVDQTTREIRQRDIERSRCVPNNVVIALSPEEHANLEANAQAAGVPLSEYARQQLVKH